MFPLSVIIGGPNNFLVGWGTLALINAGLAQSKNRSGFVWWLVSLFLGPIATFLIVISDKVEADYVPTNVEPIEKPRPFPEV